MLGKSQLSLVAFAFVVGLVVPFLISIVSIMASFRVGIAATKILVPLSSIRGIPDEVITGGNGVIYAGVALIIVLLRS